MIGRIKRKLRRFKQYLNDIDGYNAYLCILDEVLKRENERDLLINGYKIKVRTNSCDIDVAFNSFCDKEYDEIKLKDPKIIIDAGANIGTSSIFFAKKYPEALIFSIEPEVSNFLLLKHNTRKYKNITPIKSAIWGNNCRRTIQNRNTGSWGYTISETTNKTEPTGQDIECITINSIMKDYEIEKIDLLKMDIEGGEKDVLENSKDWMDLVDTITVELHDKINMGCDRAFYLATTQFEKFEKSGEKITAYRK